MATLQIPDHLEDELQIAAESSGRTKDEIAAEILASTSETNRSHSTPSRKLNFRG